MQFIFGILIVIIGVILLASPKTVYTITEKWKTAEPSEPSKAYIIGTRLGGILMIIIGVVGVISYRP